MPGPLKNTRHERFASELAQGFCACEAYGRAGYARHRQNAARLLMTNDDIKSRVSELQQAAAKNSEITVESLMAELELARQKATDLNQLSAAVRATGEKIKLSGLSVQKIEVSEPEFNDTMSITEILDRVIAERGMQAGWHLAMAMGINPGDFGITAEGFDLSAEGEKGREMRGACLDGKTFKPPVSQIEWRPPRPNKHRREVG